MEENEKNKKHYEVSFLVKSEDDVPGVIAFLNEHNVEAMTEPHAKKLALSYEIKGNKEAVFAYCRFKAAPGDVKNIERDFTVYHGAIRSLIISLPLKQRQEAVRNIPSEGKPQPLQHNAAPRVEMKTAPSMSLSNEALTKKIEEILK